MLILILIILIKIAIIIMANKAILIAIGLRADIDICETLVQGAITGVREANVLPCKYTSG